MLKYFKRQKSRKGDDKEQDSVDKRRSSFCDEIFYDGDERRSAGSNAALNFDQDIFLYHSRLSMSLSSIVSNPNCLSYFVQYLEMKNALPLIKFYLDTENFKTAAVSQLNDVRKVEGAVRTEAKARNESNCVPELKTLCDLSMRQPLTDDEKSQIYAETNKQITKCHKNSYTNNNISCSNNNHKLTKSSSDKGAAAAVNGLQTVTAASVRDAIAIYQKYLIANANHFVRLPVAILSQISLLLCKRNDDDDSDDDGDSNVISSTSAQISAQCFDEAQKYVLDVMEREYLHDFLQSTFYCKYCIELIENASTERGEKLSIYDILHSEVALFFFMEFLEQRGERNCLDFWTTAINYRKSFAIETLTAKDVSTDAQSDAMIIYEKFFSLQADFRLWMSDKLRCRVEERICSDECGQIANCFDLPLQVTAKYLEQKHFDDFLKSQLFQNYLNELKTKVHEELAFGTLSKATDLNATRKLSMRRATRHRKTLSDCTNESTQNTLLAMDTSQKHLLRNQLHNATPGTNLSIDAQYLTNPSLLWQREWATSSTNTDCGGGGLKFGHVNALGRYERDFDAVDGSKQSNWSLTEGSTKLKNAMRKLVNLPEEKVQEEIAWQVAEMIVNDVTSVTLNNGSAWASA